MTDFTAAMVDSRQQDLDKQSPGNAFVNQIESKKKAEEDKRIDGKFRSAYEAAGLDSVGVKEEAYDFREAFDQGVSFKSSKEGGVKLPNSHIKENGAEIAGRDFRTGKQMRNKWQDDDGMINTGLSSLRNSTTDTQYGSPWDDVDGLNRVATGIYRQGGSFDEFKSELENTPWHSKLEQAAVAWNSATTVADSTKYADENGARWSQAAIEPVEGYDPTNKYEGLTEADLPANEDWLTAARTIYQFQTGEDPSGLTDEDASSQLLSMMGLFWNNLPEMMLMANQAERSENPEYAQAFMTAMDMYDASDMDNWNETGRFLKGQISDVTNYLTFGGGMIATKLAGASMRAGVKKSLVKMLAGLSVDVAAGAGLGAGMESSTQQVEIAAGEREGYDEEAIKDSALLSGVVTGAVGGPINIMADSTLRGYAAKSAKKGYNNLVSGNMKASGSPAAQRGAVGDLSAPRQVRQFDPVKKAITEVVGKDNLNKPLTAKSFQTLKNKLEQMAHKGDISWEAHDWSAIQDIKFDPEDDLTVQDLLVLTDRFTPQPEIVPLKPNYGEYSLNSDLPGYFEVGIQIPESQGLGRARSHHQGQMSGTAIGHIRGHRIGNSTLILEEQSDLATQVGMAGVSFGDKQVQRVAHAETKRALPKKLPSDPDQILNMNEVERRRLNLQLSIAEREGIDPAAKNAPAKIWDRANEAERNSLSKFIKTPGVPESIPMPVKAPYQKTWPMLMMRQQIKEAINSGSDEILWPSDIGQIAKIEQWSDDYAQSEGSGAAKYLLREKAKVAKKLGLEVDQVDRPDLVSGTYTQEIDPWHASDEQILAKREELLEHINDPNFYDDWLQASEASEKEFVALIREFELPVPVESEMESTGFNRIKLTSEVKKRFIEGGVPTMAVGGAAFTHDQKRDDKGRFSK